MPAKNPERQAGAMRLTFGGMNLTNPPDAMPQFKYPYALNCRAYQGSAVGPRLPQGVPVDSSAGGPVHSLQRLNDNNVSPGYGVWVEGIGTNLFVGGSGVATGFSGKRLGMVSYRPNASPRPWMYIADTNRAVKTNALGLAAQTFNTGIPEPQGACLVADGGAGGSGISMPVFYQVKFRSSLTGAQSNPSSPMRAAVNIPGHVPVISAVPNIPPFGFDPQGDIVDVYRQNAALLNPTYVGSTTSSVFYDNTPDSDVLANPLMQFDDYEPFPSIDLPKKFQAFVTSKYFLTWVSGDQFNTRWLPGTLLQPSFVSTFLGLAVLTLYQRPGSATSLQVIEDMSAFVGDTLTITIPEPILAAQRLPALWGPTDNVGYFFAVGDPLRPGTLYFTKGNNPDSAPQTNQIEVCSPSEPLMNGAIVNGLGMVMSTERGWLIYPSFANSVATVVGVQGSPFQLIETIEGYGLVAKEGICTDGGANLFFWSKSGIRISPGGFGSQSLTDDDLYVLFPHEGQPQQSYKLGSFTVNPPDYTNTNSFALRFAEGYLYADYQDAQGGYWTLVLDTVTKGWTVDSYAVAAAIHADTQGQGVGTVTGCIDGSVRPLSPTGTEVASMILAMPSYDAGDIRATKRFADVYVDAAVQAGDVPTLGLYTSRYTSLQTSQLSKTTLPSTAGVRTGVVLDLSGGDGVFSTDLAVVFTVPLNSSPATLLYAWQPTIIHQPETILERVTDWDDGGYIGDKFIQGCRIEADTGNIAKGFSVQSADDLSIQALLESPAAFNGQSIKTFSLLSPIIAHAVRLVPTDTVPFRLWRVKFDFVPYPGLADNWQTEQTSHGFDGWQHIREINLAYLSTSALTLALVPDSQSYAIPAIIIPSSSGRQMKLQVQVPPNKFKLISYGILTSAAPFRLWKEDLQVKVGPWGRTDAYRIVRPFGGKSASGADL